MDNSITKSHERGVWAEKKALEFLESNGLKPLQTNYHGPGGEIDLIMMDNNILVFIEVRYRSKNNYIHAIETIDQKKCMRIINTGQHYLQTHLNKSDNTCRFDVVVICGEINKPEIGWIKNAFQA